MTWASACEPGARPVLIPRTHFTVDILRGQASAASRLSPHDLPHYLTAGGLVLDRYSRFPALQLAERLPP